MEQWTLQSDGAKSNVSSLQFGRIFAINIPLQTDRRGSLTLMFSLTGPQLDFVDGVDGNTVPNKALPYPALHESMSAASIGSWRGHLNA